MKTAEGLTLDFEQELPRQKTKVMIGQASQKVMVEVNKFFGKGIIEYTKYEKGEFISPTFFHSKPLINSWNTTTLKWRKYIR